MRTSKYFKMSCLLLLAGIGGCTKLNESYTSTLPADETAAALGAAGVGLLLQAAYNDVPGPFMGDQSAVFSLEENSSDESLVVTRGGDWDDNGVWRVVHNHTWNADHAQVLTVYNDLNKMSFDATNVLNFKPSKAQAAEALFIRSYALYYLLDLYGQFPVRNPGDTLLNAPKVLTGDAAIQFILADLNAALADIPAGNGITSANPDAIKTLLMKVYLNRGAFLNRAAPTFDDADMQQVISLGNSIINSGKYSYMANYWQNFDFSNKKSSEAIWIYPSPGSGNGVNNPGVQSIYERGYHYNEYTPKAPGAGWNGFTTMSDFYNSYSLNKTFDYSYKDTIQDTRIGRRVKSDTVLTKNSGIRPGYMIGLQTDQNGVGLKDRKGNPLAFTTVIDPTMIEQGSNLEVTGIRVTKYSPDFSDPNGTYFNNNVGNSVMLMRYPDVVLMVAEAYLRAATPNNGAALTLVNNLRAARGAAPMTSPLSLLDPTAPTTTTAPNSLLAERGRELYWENMRRTDLIRFGVFLTPWQYKPTDDPKYLLFPIPNQSLAVNPNLKQNPGY
jgi:starch-binding outer membrane protein, SusD/RagB family